MVCNLISEEIFDISLSNATSAKGVTLSVLLMLQLLPFVAGIGALVASVKFLHKRSIRSVFTSRNRFDWSRVVRAFMIWGGMLSLFLGVEIIMGTDIRFQFELIPFLALLLVSILIVPLQTMFEDVVFRGYLFQGLNLVVRNGVLTVLLLGSFFGWLHSGNPEVQQLGQGILIYYIVSGLFLGLLTHLDDGIELGVGYHAANNIFGALILTNDWQVFQTNALFIDHSNPNFGWDNILTLVVVQPFLIYLFHRVYKWKNVREKILGQM
jgi:membrane protease YdiL (CAAX protease family)